VAAIHLAGVGGEPCGALQYCPRTFLLSGAKAEQTKPEYCVWREKSNSKLPNMGYDVTTPYGNQ